MIEAAHDIDESDGVHVENGGGIGVVAELGRVSGEAQDVFQTDGRRAEQVALNTEDVAIAASVVQDVQVSAPLSRYALAADVIAGVLKLKSENSEGAAVAKL